MPVCAANIYTQEPRGNTGEHGGKIGMKSKKENKTVWKSGVEERRASWQITVEMCKLTANLLNISGAEAGRRRLVISLEVCGI